MVDVPELEVSRLECFIELDGSLIMQPRQVRELVLIAPNTQVILALGVLRNLAELNDIKIQWTGLGNHLENLLFLKRERLPSLKQPDLHTILLLRVRDHFSLNLSATAEHDHVGVRNDGTNPEHNRAKRKNPRPNRCRRYQASPSHSGHDYALRTSISHAPLSQDSAIIERSSLAPQ